MSIASQLTFIQNFLRNSKDVFLPVHFHRPRIYCFDPPRYQRGEGVGEGGEMCFEKYIQFIFTQVITWVEKVYKQQSTVVPFETWTLC